MSDARTPAQIEADIVRRRDQLAETLDEIGVRVHPQTIVGDAKARMVSRVDQTAGKAYVAVNRTVAGMKDRFVSDDGAPRLGGSSRWRWSSSVWSGCSRCRRAAAGAEDGAGGPGERDGPDRRGGRAGPTGPPLRRTARPRAGKFVGVSDNSHDTSHDKLPIRMLHDRVLVRTDIPEGERRSSGGIVIPATAPSGGASPGPRWSPSGRACGRWSPPTGCCTTPRTVPRSRSGAWPTY